MLEKNPKFNWFLWLISISCLAVILGAFYFFYYQKSYDFIVKVACDPAIETCIQIECESIEECPPDGISYFKRYSLNANDFQKCEGEDCTYVCENELIECELLECEEAPEFGEYCVSPATQTEKELETTEGIIEE